METESFARFVTLRRGSLLKFALVLTGDFARSEDLVADVLGRAFERWERIAETDNPLAYVRKMITNDYLSAQRRNTVWTRVRTRLASPDSSEDPTLATDQREAMIQRLTRLPPRQRAVIVMRYYLDLPDEEIGTYLDCSRATVRSHAARALTTLRVEVNSDPPDSRRRRAAHETGQR